MAPSKASAKASTRAGSIPKAPVRQSAAATVSNPLKVTVDVDLIVAVVRRHVALSPRLAKVLKDDVARLFEGPTVGAASARESVSATSAESDAVLSTQQAADLIGVSRPYLVARIEAGDIPLHQQVGNQRRVLRSAVLDWNRRESTRRLHALAQLGDDLDDEIFSR